MKILFIQAVWFLAVFALVSSPCRGQHVKILTTKDGLPQSFVSGLVQDQKGFIWVGTRNGLARYDGIEFRPFRYSTLDSTSLASNVIVSMKPYQGKISIEYESGEIDLFDPASEDLVRLLPRSRLTGNFKELRVLRRSWVLDSKQVLWGIVHGQGVNSYNTKNRQIRHFGKKNSGLASDTIWAIRRDVEHHMWVVTGKGISSLNSATGQVVNYALPVSATYHIANDPTIKIVDLHGRINGELMWGDRQHLFIFSPRSKKIRTVPLPGTSAQGLLWIDSGPGGHDYFEREGIVYKYSDQTGLSVVTDMAARTGTDVQSFLVDDSGLIWLGTNARGLFQVDLNTPFFPSFRYEKGFVGDLLARQLGTSLQEVFGWTPANEQKAASGYHIRSAKDRRGQLWVGLKETVVMFDPSGTKRTVLPRVMPLFDPAEPGITIKGIAVNASGMPVVANYRGDIVVYNQDKNRWDWLLPKGTVPGRFGSVTIRDILLDDKKLWMTTEFDGLLHIDLKTGQMGQLKLDDVAGALPTNQLLGMQPDPSRPHLLWIGSYNGLISLNKNTLKADVFGLKDRLPDQTVYSLLRDPFGQLWLGTNKGLCRFDPVTKDVRVFQTRHGLPGDEFNRFHQLQLPGGRLAFGGTEGWTLFEPSKIKDDRYRPATALTGLKINNAPLFPSKNSLLKKPINALNELVLAHDQSTLTVSFAGLQFSQPQDLRYRYQLVGYDHGWVESGPTPFANYTKIPPGKYEFQVNASNTTGQWSDQIKSLPITIHPPWWQTWWAYVAYALVIAGSIWYWMRLQLVRLELRKSVELKQQEARQLHVLSDIKSRFFNNVTHDFRTPLTLILSPMPGLISEMSGTAQEKRLVTVKRNAEQLLELMNQLLDFSKLDAHVLTVDESRGAPDVFAERIVELFREEALLQGVELSFRRNVRGEYWFDAPKLERMLGNLIGNAIKFTPAGGRVAVSVEAIGQWIVFAVADTGIGIPENRIAYVFDRYYQVDDTELHQLLKNKGTGIGLSLVKEFAELQNGKVEVESQEGEGTTFRLMMPYQPVGHDVSETTFDHPETALQVAEPIVLGDEKVHILLVEDNLELADFINDSLPDAYQISRAVNGAEGFNVALEQVPDLIISDVMMPVMDGFTFCKKVKQHEQTSHIPVILLTAKANVDSRIEGLSLGADDYLSKPFHVQELNLRVHNQLEQQRRLRRQMQKLLSPFSGEAENPTVPDLVDPFLQKFHNLIEDRLDDASLGVEQWDELMGMSRVQLHRKLKAVSGLPAGDVVRNYRLTRAAAFLKEGYNSSESAYRSGFDSPAYFTKSFREYYGKTPSEFVGK
ncbi:hybrid sensor histidine kinase/response regulator transcription factor [Larkinella rosea]|uniref:histidine kinase n=1 Tax=Larkinella rosea TaxID=2025312 RepID=A0A3P1BAT3_9BACT|nr:hybrid sensor histidine kinase/response regulator transcription factor [Larkinella rosea]RRA98095.1 hybrid sensor histidine kinase/response regulator [Larkinella rosea]